MEGKPPTLLPTGGFLQRTGGKPTLLLTTGALPHVSPNRRNPPGFSYQREEPPCFFCQREQNPVSPGNESKTETETKTSESMLASRVHTNDSKRQSTLVINCYV